MSDVLRVCLSQTRMSAARTTAAASTSASTRSARTFVSAATVLYCMRTNMTVRKVGFTCTHTRTRTGTSPSAHTYTCCRIRTSMCSCTRADTGHITATLFRLFLLENRAFLFILHLQAELFSWNVQKKSQTSLHFTLHRPPPVKIQRNPLGQSERRKAIGLTPHPRCRPSLEKRFPRYSGRCPFTFPVFHKKHFIFWDSYMTKYCINKGTLKLVKIETLLE